MPGTVWWQWAVLVEDASGGGTGGGGKQALSFRLGGFLPAVPSPSPGGDTVLHTWDWDGEGSGSLQLALLPPSQGAICTPGRQSEGCGPRCSNRCAQVGVPIFSTCARWLAAGSCHLAGLVGWLWGQGARRAASPPHALPCGRKCQVSRLGAEAPRVLPSSSGATPRSWWGRNCATGIRRCRHRDGAGV